MLINRFALVYGIVFLLVGIAGFIPGATVMPHDQPGMTPGGMGLELGLFPVNILHNVVHLVFGAWGIAAARSVESARLYARATAVIYAVFTVMGLIPVLDTAFGLVPLYGADVALHAVLAIVAGYFGFARSNTVQSEASVRPR